MPRLILTEGAQRGLRRCRQFLMEKSGLASVRAALTIKQSLSLLEAAPEIGRPVPERLGLRELIIPFGASGYVALYRYDPETDVATILSFRHQKEAGY